MVLVYTKAVDSVEGALWLALVKLRISFAIYLRATREKIAPLFSFVTRKEIIQSNFLWRKLSHCFRKTTIHLGVGG